MGVAKMTTPYQILKKSNPVTERVKISSVAHTIGLVWRYFDRVTSKWFSIEEAFI